MTFHVDESESARVVGDAEYYRLKDVYCDGDYHHFIRQGVGMCMSLIEAQRAEIERLRAGPAKMREALEIIAGERQCLDNMMSNADVARAGLSGYSICQRNSPALSSGRVS